MKHLNLLTKSKSVIYLEGVVNYTIFHFNGGQKAVSSQTLKKYEFQPNFGFFIRISKGLMVNPGFISIVKKDGDFYSIKLANGKVLQASSRKGKVFKDFT